MSHKFFLLQALQQAKYGNGICAPNPAVGAVVVKNNAIIAQGFHKGAGTAHAEVDAITKLNDIDCDGATLYVTLEPCCHYGRTPPCTELIIKKRFSAVYYAYRDPNPLVLGRGEQVIQAARIVCKHFPLPAIDNFYESYEYWIMHKRAFVTAKLAMSLDGKIALKGNKPIQLTNSMANNLTHQYRKDTDAILSTSQTIISDNPRFDARIDNRCYKKKLFIIDGHRPISTNAKIFSTTEEITLLTNMPEKYKSQTAISCQKLSADENKINLQEAIDYISQLGIHNIFVESGGTLLTSLLKENLINRLLIYVCPTILGEHAIPAITDATTIPKASWKIFDDVIMGLFDFKLKPGNRVSE